MYTTPLFSQVLYQESQCWGAGRARFCSQRHRKVVVFLLLFFLNLQNGRTAKPLGCKTYKFIKYLQLREWILKYWPRLYSFRVYPTQTHILCSPVSGFSLCFWVANTGMVLLCLVMSLCQWNCVSYWARHQTCIKSNQDNNLSMSLCTKPCAASTPSNSGAACNTCLYGLFCRATSAKPVECNRMCPA